MVQTLSWIMSQRILVELLSLQCRLLYVILHVDFTFLHLLESVWNGFYVKPVPPSRCTLIASWRTLFYVFQGGFEKYNILNIITKYNFVYNIRIRTKFKENIFHYKLWHYIALFFRHGFENSEFLNTILHPNILTPFHLLMRLNHLDSKSGRRGSSWA